MARQPKNAMIAIRLTKEEADAIRAAASAEGLSVSAFVRRAAVMAARDQFPAPVKDPTSFPIPEELVPLFLSDADGKFNPDLWWWSFDTFFIGFIRIAAKKLREDGHGCPNSMTETEWVDYLLQIENDLTGYNVVSAGWGKNDEAYLKAQQAVYRFADLLGAWWH